MKKTIYYNESDSETELNFFINNKKEISFFIETSGQNPSSISLQMEDVKDMIRELEKLICERPK
jgi:hypothetical protein